MTAIKNDQHKPDLSLIPRIGLVRCSEAFMVGAKKYGRNNYKEGSIKKERLIAAIMRHIVAYNEGEEWDSDGQHHLGSVMAGAAMLLELQRLGKLVSETKNPKEPKTQEERDEAHRKFTESLHYVFR